MNQKYYDLIYKEFMSCVTSKIQRMAKIENRRPFHEALLSKDALFWSRFERSFSTSFGQRTIERISEYAVLSNGASDSKRQKETFAVLDQGCINAIDANIEKSREGMFSNWGDSLAEVLSAPKTGKGVRVRVISDLWWMKDGINNYVSIKTVQPNIDQTAASKSDCLKLKANDSQCNVYFGLYYNPYGDRREDYAFSPPGKIYDMINDPVVLIGKDYWDCLGGSGFYEEVLSVAQDVGSETKEIVNQYGGELRIS